MSNGMGYIARAYIAGRPEKVMEQEFSTYRVAHDFVQYWKNLEEDKGRGDNFLEGEVIEYD